ncbi:MAG: histone deacetylase family protein [Pseudomonadota bacterium]
MKLFWSDKQNAHSGARFLKCGQLVASPEVPERSAAILSAIGRSRHTVHAPSDLGLDPIVRVHDLDYLNFLKSIHTDWVAEFGEGSAILPNVLSDKSSPSMAKPPRSLIGALGYYSGDLAAEIRAGTWGASYMSAQCAANAARLTRQTGAASYALCRPPGHHAGKSWAMGFCFLNNAAIAAEELRLTYSKVAVVDVDVHHGNGTQAIFYERSDVLTTSMHSDPDFLYPFHSGREDETGFGAGIGHNVNVCYSKDARDDDFVSAFSRVERAVTAFEPDALVVALGVDALQADPHSGHMISPDGYMAIARRLKAWSLPTVLVQEGGYLSDQLGPTVASFLSEASDD